MVKIMNYGRNTVDWDVGDLVLHDADEKNTQMLMRVVEVKREDGLIKTVYVNRKGSKPHYLNRKEVLHDPAIFIDGMKLMLERHDVPQSLKDAAMVLAVVTNELGFGDEKLPGVIERGKKVLNMPAISFQREFLDDLLSNKKQHTTRPQTDRFKVGDIAQLYLEQRRRILDKPLRRLTMRGCDVMCERGYPMIPAFHQAAYPAHFLGKVVITDVYDVLFCEMTGEELEEWAWRDNFKDTDQAEAWFQTRYGDGWWFKRDWTGIGWHGWLERYFSAGELKMVVGDV